MLDGQQDLCSVKLGSESIVGYVSSLRRFMRLMMPKSSPPGQYSSM